MKEILERTNQYLLFGILFVIVLYFGRPLLIPIVFAAMLAMLFASTCSKLERHGLSRALACFTCILILIAVIALIASIIGAQVASFTRDLPQLEAKVQQAKEEVTSYIEYKFNVSKEKQETVAKEQAEKASESAGGLLGVIIASLTSTIGSLLLTLVYTFLFLYNRERYETFFVKLYMDHDTEKVKNIVGKITLVSQQYLTGRALSILIIATLYSIGLLIVGIKNAILLGGVAALLTLIPYLGTVLGGLIPVVMALVTEDSFHPALMAGVVLLGIQTIDNYFIEPNVVGGQVHLAALPTILGIITGGIIWGPAGMILFIPMLAIAKIIFDHVEDLKPYGYLIGGQNGDEPSAFRQWIKRLTDRIRNKKT